MLVTLGRCFYIFVAHTFLGVNNGDYIFSIQNETRFEWRQIQAHDSATFNFVKHAGHNSLVDPMLSTLHETYIQVSEFGILTLHAKQLIHQNDRIGQITGILHQLNPLLPNFGQKLQFNKCCISTITFSNQYKYIQHKNQSSNCQIKWEVTLDHNLMATVYAKKNIVANERLTMAWYDPVYININNNNNGINSAIMEQNNDNDIATNDMNGANNINNNNGINEEIIEKKNDEIIVAAENSNDINDMDIEAADNDINDEIIEKDINDEIIEDDNNDAIVETDNEIIDENNEQIMDEIINNNPKKKKKMKNIKNTRIFKEAAAMITSEDDTNDENENNDNNESNEQNENNENENPGLSDDEISEQEEYQEWQQRRKQLLNSQAIEKVTNKYYASNTFELWQNAIANRFPFNEENYNIIKNGSIKLFMQLYDNNPELYPSQNIAENLEQIFDYSSLAVYENPRRNQRHKNRMQGNKNRNQRRSQRRSRSLSRSRSRSRG